MRLWHYELLPYLPELQFKWQLRELVVIMHDWRDNGKTNHLLINGVMKYLKKDLSTYFYRYMWIYYERYGKHISKDIRKEFENFAPAYRDLGEPIFEGWHNREYLRVCMANLYEKHVFGVGKSKISDEEWQKLVYGYRQITGENYVI
jgi:hypothetical protein